MSLRLGVIADDYTGASDVAAMLEQNGLRTVQTIGVPDAALDLPEIDALVVSLKSRSVAPDAAVAQSLAAEHWLRDRGAGHVLFKVCSTFDSTDAGNIGPVADALRARAGCGTILVNPAFPETGRSVFQGHLFVNGVPLNESPLKDHPLNPMRDSSLVRVLQRQSAFPVGLIPFAVVEQGVDAVRAALATMPDAGAAIADAVAPRHLDVLGQAALDLPLSVGASGLAAGLARALIARDGSGPRRPERDHASRTGRRAAILAGSCSAATLAQIAVARASGLACLQLDIARLLEGDADAIVSEAVDWSGRQTGTVLIASSAAPEAVRAMQRSHGDVAAGHAVEQAFATIAAALLDGGVTRLVVAGGETSGAVVDRLRIEAFDVGNAIAPGVPVLRALGRRHPGLSMALKSGNFGGEDFFARALDALP